MTTQPFTTQTLANVPTTIAPPSHVGGSVSLLSDGTSAPELVTLVKVVDPAQGADSFSQPLSGDRLVGLELAITIGGSSLLTDDPMSDTVAEDAQDNVYSPTVANLQSCPAFPPGLTLRPNQSVTGCVAFDLGPDTMISTVMFMPGNPFGNVTAEWKVP